MASQGRVVAHQDGNQTFEPDYVRALELFRRLVQEFAKGETRYWDQAQQQIKNITDPQIGVGVPNIFLPDSEVQYSLNWRNVKQIELARQPDRLKRIPVKRCRPVLSKSGIMVRTAIAFVAFPIEHRIQSGVRTHQTIAGNFCKN